MIEKMVKTRDINLRRIFIFNSTVSKLEKAYEVLNNNDAIGT